MTPELSSILAALTDEDLFAVTLFGEARGESIEGVVAVACVIRNRVQDAAQRYGSTYRAVCLKPRQFSCWMPSGGRKNYELTIAAARAVKYGFTSGSLERCRGVAKTLMRGTYPDKVAGANHYCTLALFEKKPPSWAHHDNVTATVDGHVFFRL